MATTTETKSVKDQVRSILEQMPDDCTLEDVSYHLYVVSEIQKGIRDIDEGRTVPHEVVRQEMAKWLSE